MEIGGSKGVTKCVNCLRTKDEAIAEHLATNTPCDCFNCPFKDAISAALEEKKRVPWKISPKKSTMKIVKK